MNKAEYEALMPGDVIRVYNKDGLYHVRTVLPSANIDGDAYAQPDRRNKSHHFPIMRGSWTQRPVTVIGWQAMLSRIEAGDVTKLEFHRRLKPGEPLMTDEELWRLIELGFPTREAWLRELDQCGTFDRLPESAKLRIRKQISQLATRFDA